MVLPQTLTPNTLYLFFCDPLEPGVHEHSEHYQLWLSEDEMKRKNRFYFPKHQHQFLVTRALIREILAYYLKLEPHALRFIKNQYGRPDLDPSQQIAQHLSFNVSHTEGLILLGVCLGYTLGVDVENKTKVRRILEIADSVFADSEIKALKALPKSQQNARFFYLWTLKEAYIKACGMGLSIPLEHFAFAFNDQHLQLNFYHTRKDDADLWQYALLSPGDPDQQAAFAVYGYQHKPNLNLVMYQGAPLVGYRCVHYPLTHQG